MLSALSLAAAMAAGAAGPASADAAQSGASAQSQQSAAPSSAGPSQASPTESCPPPSADNRIIVVCTQRYQGYRLNPDVMEAKREMHSGGRPVRPGGFPPPDCATVGPFPCTVAGIDLIGAALTAAEMAERLAKGQEVGSMFKTDPHPSEYQLYQMAKARREAEEAKKVAMEKAKAHTARQGAGDPQPAGN